MDPRIEELEKAFSNLESDRADAGVIADDLAYGVTVDPTAASEYINILLVGQEELFNTGMDAIEDILAQLEDARQEVDLLQEDILAQLEDVQREVDLLQENIFAQLEDARRDVDFLQEDILAQLEDAQ